jgi:hypothetical protein
MTVTRSKLLDSLVFGALLVGLLLLAPRLRVYYRITVMQVQVDRLGPDGVPERVPTPGALEGLHLHQEPPAIALRTLSEKIRRHVRQRLPGEDDGRLRWTIRYSFNSTARDREVEVPVE